MILIRETIKLLSMFSTLRDFCSLVWSERHIYMSTISRLIKLQNLEQWTEIAEQAIQLQSIYLAYLEVAETTDYNFQTQT